jgi:chromosome segregation ATPase
MAPTLEDLDRRTTALERAQGETTQTLRWVVAKLGRMQAVQDEHTLRLERIETRLERIETRLERIETRLDGVETRVDGVEARLDRIERKLDGLIEALPGIVADAVRAARA